VVEGQNPHKHHGAAMLHKLAIVVVKNKKTSPQIFHGLYLTTLLDVQNNFKCQEISQVHNMANTKYVQIGGKVRLLPPTTIRIQKFCNQSQDSNK
jgi:hypothetical protein